ASPCRRSCYRANTVVAGRMGAILLRIDDPHARKAPATITFAPPARLPAPNAADIVRRATATILQQRALVVHSRLASDAAHHVTTTYDEVAPDRLEYRNGDGSASIIIGSRRWDRTSKQGAWRESSQDPPLREPVPFWPDHVVDAHILRSGKVHGDPAWIVSFL